jgi:hypothetical protein
MTTIAIFGFATFNFAQTVPSYIPTEELVGWWPFNGNANDESGNENNGTVNGAVLTEDRFGVANAAYEFDGVDDYIIGSADLLPPTDRTVSLWFFGNTIGEGDKGKQILGYGGNECGQSWIMLIDSWEQNTYEISGHCNANATYSSYGETQPNGSWHHMVASSSVNGTYLYLDGNLIEVAASTFVDTYVAGKDFLFGAIPFNNGIGFYNDVYTNPWDGSLDDIGIWNRALSQEEISNLFNATNCSNNLTITPTINQLQTGNNANFIATTSDTFPSYVWQSDFGQGYVTLNNYGNYSGVNTNSLSISNVQLSEHNQPIRVISTSGECIDTSNVATINITDTCIVTINDTITTLISVTDTLVINTLITGLTPPNNSNTIKVFPNPSNSHITIDFGNFESMNGYTLTITNSIGQTVYTTPINEQSSYVDLSTWSGNGIYFVQIIDTLNNTIENRKIVLQ